MDLTLLTAVGIVAVVLVGVWLTTRGPRLATPSLRAEAIARWGHGCAYRFPVIWRSHLYPLHIDHQWSRSWFGRTVPSNLMPLCERCNLRKSARWSPWFVLTRSFPVLGWLWFTVRWIRAEVLR